MRRLYFLMLVTIVLGISYDIDRSKLIDKFACITHCSREQIVAWNC